FYTVWWMYAFAGGFLNGVYPVFLHSRGLSQLQVNSILATYFVVVLLTEVPTGAFADAFGRRLSFVVGMILRSMAFALYFFSYTYVGFVVAESIDAIGTTFISGSIDAWGVDALDDAGYAEVKDRLFSRVMQFMQVGFGAAAIIGAYVAMIDISYPWMLGAAGYMVTAFVGARLMREGRGPQGRFKLRSIPALLANQMNVSLRYGLANRAVLFLSLASAMTMAAWAPYWLEWPILLTTGYGQGVWVVGWIFALLTLARVIGSEIVLRLPNSRDARPARVCVLVGAAALTFFVAGLFGARPIVTFSVLVVMNLFNGAMQPLTMSWLNEHIDSARRATLLSFNSSLSMCGGSIGLLISGYVVDRAGIPVAWQLGAIIALGAIPFYLALRAVLPAQTAVEGVAG
ncbi:MAG: MFS transporter, partial [Candidatus Binataceae bacterium]